MFEQETLNVLTKRFAKSGRNQLSWWQKFGYLNIKRPSWCGPDDLLSGLFENKWELIKHGNIVWGQIVQANNLLFRPGFDDCPGYIVFNPDPTVEPNLDLLEHVAEAMMTLKGTTPDNPELAAVAKSLTDEMTRCLDTKVPDIIAGGQHIYHSSIFITRKHLPNQRLSRLVMPIVVNPQPPYYCVPLPSRYWTDELVIWWHNQR